MYSQYRQLRTPDSLRHAVKYMDMGDLAAIKKQAVPSSEEESISTLLLISLDVYMQYNNTRIH